MNTQFEFSAHKNQVKESKRLAGQRHMVSLPNRLAVLLAASLDAADVPYKVVTNGAAQTSVSVAGTNAAEFYRVWEAFNG